MDIEKIRKQARDESTSSEMLAELATKEDTWTRKYVATNPNAPLKTLERLAKEFPEEIIANPIFELLLLENPQNTSIHLSVARSPKASVETLTKLSKYDNFDIREAVAKNLNTPLNVLDELTVRTDEKRFPARIFTAIAENPNATADILDKLIQAGKCLPVHLAVLKNSQVSIKTLERLANDPDASIENPVFKHPKVNSKFLEKLSFSPYINVRKAVAEHSKTNYSTINLLAKDKLESVRITIAKRQDITPEIIEILAQDSSEKVRYQIAKCKRLPEKIISNLAQDSSERVRYRIAYHQNVTQEIISNLAQDSSEEVRCQIACRQNIAEDIVSVLASDSSEKVRYQIAQNRATSVNIANMLAQDSSEEVRCQIACRQNIAEVTANTLAHDSSEEVRYQIAQNRAISERIANILAQDSSERVRRQLVNHRYYKRPSKYYRSTPIINQNVSARTLEILLKKSDENNYPELPHNINLDSPGLKLKKDYPISAICNLETRKDIARHPQATYKILDRLKSDRHDCVRQAVASNENSSYPDIIEYLAKDSSENVRYQIAKRRDIPEKVARFLAKDSSERVRLELAINRNISATILQIIFDNSYDDKSANFASNIDLRSIHNSVPHGYELAIRWEIASHPKATFEILDRLKSDRYDYIRQAVASNRNNLYPEIIRDLANDSAVIVRAAIAINIKSHEFTLAALPSEKNNIYTFEGILNKLANDDLTVRRAVANNPYALKDILKKLAHDDNKTVRQAVASNSNTSEKVLEQLKNDDAAMVRLAIAKNPNTSLNALKELSIIIDEYIAKEAKLNLEEKQTAIQQASKGNTLPAVLTKLAKSKYKIIRQYVASNVNTPITTLETLSKEFPEEITANPVFTLLMLENPTSPFVQLSLARSSTTSEKTLVKLYHINCKLELTESFKILVAIANNNAASSKIRKQLKFEIRAILRGGAESNYTL